MNVFELIIKKLEEHSSKAEQNMNYYKELAEKDASCEVFADAHKKEYEAYQEAISIVDLAEEEYNNGWIPCNEKQPEIRGAYLVTTKVNDFLHVQIMSYDGKAWIGPINTVDYGDVSNRVFAWQPLPETYKG